MTKNQHAMAQISATAVSTDRLPGLKDQINRRIARREGYLGHLKALNERRIRAKLKRRYDRAQALATAEAQKKGQRRVVEG